LLYKLDMDVSKNKKNVGQLPGQGKSRRALRRAQRRIGAINGGKGSSRPLRKQGAASSPYAGVNVVRNPIFVNGGPSNPGVRTLEVKVPLNNGSLFRVINSWGQYFMVIANSSPISDDSQGDLQNAVQAIFQDLTLNAMIGGKSYFEDADIPQIYRDLFVALIPKSPAAYGGVNFKYSFDPTTIPTSFQLTDGVVWGKQQQNEYGATGLSILSAFTPATDLGSLVASTKRFFSMMLSIGHRKWMQKPTAFEQDTSAFAAFVPATVDTVVDFNNTSGTSQHEVPIRSTWLAGLQLTSLSKSRFSKFQRTIYAGPQSYMGHRLIGFFSGQDGALDQVRVQRVDVQEFMYQAEGILTGAATQYLLSPGNAAMPTPPWVNTIPFDAYLNMLMNVLATAAMSESPVTLGLTDPFGVFVPLPFGSQFTARDNMDSGVVKWFMVAIENARRLKFTVTEEGRGQRVFLYNALSTSAATYDFYNSWAPNVFPVSYDVRSSTDTTTGQVMSINNYGLDATGDFAVFWSEMIILLQAYTRFSDVTAEREQSAQMLTNLLRIVAPSPVGMRNSLQRSNSKGALPLYAEKVFEGVVRRKGKTLVAPTAAFAPLTLGINVAQASRRPANPAADKMFVLVVPISYGNPDPTTPDLDAAMIPAFGRLGVYTFNKVQNILTTYYLQLASTGTQMTYRADADNTPNELLQTFKNRTDLGLGGAAGSVVEGLFGLAKKEKIRNIGKMLGPVVDGLVNMFPKTRKMNNMIK